MKRYEAGGGRGLLAVERNTLQHNTFQCTATHCNAVQRKATHCKTLQITATHCNTLQGSIFDVRRAAQSRSLQCVVVWCSVVQCGAVWCSVLQCVAVCCSVLQCVTARYSVLQCVAVCCSVLQCVAVCCSVLQCVAVCCNTVQEPLWLHTAERAPWSIKRAHHQGPIKRALLSMKRALHCMKRALYPFDQDERGATQWTSPCGYFQQKEPYIV